MTEITVRGYHTDFYGHVNNARYLEFFEEDRWAKLGSAIDLQKFAREGYVFLVVNINVNYRKAVPLGATILVSTELEKIGGKSAALKQVIVFKETKEAAADAVVTFVVRDAMGRVAPMEGDLLEELNKLL